MAQPSNLLDEALGLSKASLPPGQVVLIKDCVETSGAFVLHHLVKRSLSPETTAAVLFVALAQPFSHYDRILRKQGCNLVTQRENGRFFFFDMLKLNCPDVNEESITQGGLVYLYRQIYKACSLPEQRSSSIIVMIDDISLLEVAAHGSSNHVLDFLHYCHALTSELGCSVVLLSHDDIYSSAMAPAPIMQMEYLADLVIKAEPLVTGLATDVHGQLTVLKKGIVDDHDGSLRNKLYNFHFKVKENSVDYFYPGSRN